MSIASNLTALDAAKDAIATSITGKGVTVGAGDGLADFAALIDSISGGEGLPSWLTEYEVVTYSPGADTNAAHDFTLTMDNTPNAVMVISDFTAPVLTRDWWGCFGQNFFGVHGTAMAGYYYYSATNTTSLNGAGTNIITGVSNTNVTVSPYVYGGTACYWRAGKTYTMIALKVAL